MALTCACNEGWRWAWWRGHDSLMAVSKVLTIVDTNPTSAAIKTRANLIGASKIRFRKQMRQESPLWQFTTRALGFVVANRALAACQQPSGDSASL